MVTRAQLKVGLQSARGTIKELEDRICILENPAKFVVGDKVLFKYCSTDVRGQAMVDTTLEGKAIIIKTVWHPGMDPHWMYQLWIKKAQRTLNYHVGWGYPGEDYIEKIK